MDALRIAAGTISMVSDDACAIVAQCPTIVATLWRLRRGGDPIAPRPDLGHAANFLYMLDGQPPDAERTRGLETYLNTVVDHGLNASTFTARVITSTGSDLVSAVVGALGALKGPLHGGAPGPALDLVFEIGGPLVRRILRQRIASGERLMGFRHRLQGSRPAGGRAGRRGRTSVHPRRRSLAIHAGTLGRSHRAPAARGAQTGSPASNERRVLHSAPAPWPRARSPALYPDVCHQQSLRMDRSRARATRHEPHHQAAVPIRRPARAPMGSRPGATRSDGGGDGGRVEFLIAARISRNNTAVKTVSLLDSDRIGSSTPPSGGL